MLNIEYTFLFSDNGLWKGVSNTVSKQTKRLIYKYALRQDDGKKHYWETLDGKRTWREATLAHSEYYVI